ncbi:MAG: OsmC family protein [Bacteroidales bacterium]|nr:OsmC family protein [Bacteroidales bacterium]
MAVKEKEVVSTKWLENMSFESEINGHKVMIDAKVEVGGQDKGPRPKPLMLAALGGCTAMDVISILAKMRVELKSLNVIVEGDLTDEHPKHFHKMHVIYEIEGDNLPMDKIEKAVRLSEEKYCGVSVVYRKVMEITSEIRIKE